MSNNVSSSRHEANPSDQLLTEQGPRAREHQSQREEHDVEESSETIVISNEKDDENENSKKKLTWLTRKIDSKHASALARDWNLWNNEETKWKCQTM